MPITFSFASPGHSDIVAELVTALTEEICARTHVKHFGIELEGTKNRCHELLSRGQYGAVIAYADGIAAAVATFTETYALYAGGKVGLIPEFYVVPHMRSAGVGALLIEKVRAYGRQHGWSCIELCTPPLPEFERTLSFYQRHGLAPVGGRKMRQYLD